MAKKEKKEGGAKRSSLTFEQLKAMGLRGTMIILARLAYTLGAKSKFTGTKWAGKDGKSTAGSFYLKAGPNGAVLTVPAENEAFKAAVSAAKGAQGDIAKGTWSPAVAKFLEAILAVNVGGGGGGKNRNYSVASDLKF